MREVPAWARVGDRLADDAVGQLLDDERAAAHRDDDIRLKAGIAGRAVDQIGERDRQPVHLQERRMQLLHEPPYPLGGVGQHRACRRERLRDPRRLGRRASCAPS